MSLVRMHEVEPERLILSRRKKMLTREERVAFGFLVTCGTLAVVFGGLFFASNVYKPFLISYTGPRYLSSSEKESEQVALQRLSDTDGDTVSDYDELYVFLTSPYIADTDSDGRNDGVEITEGGDPQCPIGKTCVSSELIVESLPEGLINIPEPQQSPEVPAPTLEQTIGALQTLTVDEVRQFFREAGMDSVTLDSLTDEQVTALYEEALQQASQDLEKSPSP